MCLIIAKSLNGLLFKRVVKNPAYRLCDFLTKSDIMECKKGQLKEMNCGFKLLSVTGTVTKWNYFFLHMFCTSFLHIENFPLLAVNENIRI